MTAMQSQSITRATLPSIIDNTTRRPGTKTNTCSSRRTGLVTGFKFTDQGTKSLRATPATRRQVVISHLSSVLHAPCKMTLAKAVSAELASW